MSEQDPNLPATYWLKEMRLRLTYFPPMGHGEIMHTDVRVSEQVFRDVFAPLPDPHFSYFTTDAQQAERWNNLIKAAEMKKQRRELAQQIAERLAHELLALVESKDPHYGFSPEQWEDITREL